MGKDEQQSEPLKSKSGTATSNLDAITQDLKHLRQTLVVQLFSDIRYLQARKTRLQGEVEELEQQRRTQAAQQQKLVQQIAPALIDKLEHLLRQRLQQTDFDPTAFQDHHERTHQLVSSLDSTLRLVFQTLEQDIGSYQSSLSHRLNQMHSLEQQGEVLLDVLVHRLQAQLSYLATTPPQPPEKCTLPQRETMVPTHPSSQAPDPLTNGTSSSTVPQTSSRPGVALASKPSLLSRIVRQQKATDPRLQLGFAFVLLSTLALSFYNVVVAGMLTGASVLGSFEFEQVLPSGLGNVLLMLGLRMLVVVPLMIGLANLLYPKTWSDMGEGRAGNQGQLWLPMIGSGFFLFLSQVLIYFALGSNLSPGEVITLFFIFPVISILLFWLFFAERPSKLMGIASILVLLGMLVLSGSAHHGMGNFPWLGVVTAVSAGLTFAFYVLLTRVCAKQLHPVSLSFINFCTILVLSGLSFLLSPVRDSVSVASDNWLGVTIGSLVLGGLTLVSYLLNNLGISRVGAARASIFGAVGPVSTSLVAWLFLGSTLSPGSFLGIVIVTMGVFALSLERLRHRFESSKTS